MATIYITGHKNPDMDSACAAAAYARFKTLTDPANRYIPVRCGALNNPSKFIFAKAGLETPLLLPDVYPRAGEVTRRNLITLRENDPVYDAVRRLDENTVSVLPVLNQEGAFQGLVSVHEISQFFISEVRGHRPEFYFLAENVEKVLPGRMLHQGRVSQVTTCIMIGAMPYEDSIRRMQEVLPTKPVFVVGLRRDLIAHAVQEQFPAIVLTGVPVGTDPGIDFTGYTGWVFVSERDTAETARLLRLSVPVARIMDTQAPRLPREQPFEKARDSLVTSRYRGLPVFDGEAFYGIVTRRCFIERPAAKLILVDHNELAQSIPGAEQAEVLEILDHHRLAFERTRHPIYVAVRPVGCTCTIIYDHYRAANVEIEPEVALLMLAGILSDTVNLRSPTTTTEDRRALKELAAISGADPDALAREIFAQAHDLDTVDPQEVVEADFKSYDEAGVRFGVGQVEVSTLEKVGELKTSLGEALQRTQRLRGLDWALLLITDVVEETSLLITTDFPRAESSLIYKQLEPHLYELPGVLSRKKQLLPEILRALEEALVRPG